MNTAEQVVHVDDAMRIFEEIRQELLKEGKLNWWLVAHCRHHLLNIKWLNVIACK